MMRHNDANKTSRRTHTTSSHMRDCQSFEKIDNFLKPVLDILILCNLVAGLCEGVIKEGAGILYQTYRFRGGV